MGTRKIKRRKKTVRVPCDHLVYEDEDGEESNLREGQWVEFKKKLTANDMAQMLQFAGLAENDNLVEMAEELPSIYDLLARKLVAWNWTDLDEDFDEEGDQPLLPEPSLEVIGELDFDDILNLVEMLMDLVETPKKAS